MQRETGSTVGKERWLCCGHFKYQHFYSQGNHCIYMERVHDTIQKHDFGLVSIRGTCLMAVAIFQGCDSRDVRCSGDILKVKSPELLID